MGKTFTTISGEEDIRDYFDRLSSTQVAGRLGDSQYELISGSFLPDRKIENLLGIKGSLAAMITNIASYPEVKRNPMLNVEDGGSLIIFEWGESDRKFLEFEAI